MTPEEFVIWMRGFTQSANEYNITPKQWQDIKDKLDSVIMEKYDITEETEINKYVFVDNSDWYFNSTSGSYDIIYYTYST